MRSTVLAAFQERLVFELLFAAGHLDLAEPHALALAHQLARPR